ncbi:MAG: methanogenesis marker 17 protein [Euryarchaeota archaeon]|nr:methanogenesis marker 17 protein [Euryarchaeota archaeon]
MKVEIEGPEKYGSEEYVELFNGILLDVGITRMVEAVRFIINPPDPLFLISVRTRRSAGAVSIAEIAEVSQGKEGVLINIIDETYAPTLILLLWRRYGRERIEQLSRLEILCRGVSEKEVSAITIDPVEELRSRVLDAIWRLLPEGLKIRHNIASEKVLTVVATEYEMRKEWVELAEKVHREMEAADV